MKADMQMREGMIPSISKDEISEMVSELAREIERDYDGKELVMICPLKGSVLFMADLCRKIKLPQVIDFVYVTSPRGKAAGSCATSRSTCRVNTF